MLSWVGKLVALAAKGGSDNKNNRKAFLQTAAVVSVFLDKDDSSSADLLKKAAFKKINAEVLESQAQAEALFAAVEEKRAKADLTRANAELARAKAEVIIRDSKTKQIKATGEAIAAFAKLKRAGGSISFSTTEIIQILRTGTQEFPDDLLIAHAASTFKETEH